MGRSVSCKPSIACMIDDRNKPSRIFEQTRVRSWSTQSTSQRARRSTSYSLCITESREHSVRSHKSLLDDNDSGGSHWDLQSFTPPPSDENKSDSSSKSVELACKGCRPNTRKNSSSMHDPECSRSPSCGSERAPSARAAHCGVELPQ